MEVRIIVFVGILVEILVWVWAFFLINVLDELRFWEKMKAKIADSQ